jgi:hypothetical protein
VVPVSDPLNTKIANCLYLFLSFVSCCECTRIPSKTTQVLPVYARKKTAVWWTKSFLQWMSLSRHYAAVQWNLRGS